MLSYILRATSAALVPRRQYRGQSSLTGKVGHFPIVFKPTGDRPKAVSISRREPNAQIRGEERGGDRHIENGHKGWLAGSSFLPNIQL